MMDNTGMQDSQKLADLIKESVRTSEVVNYNGLACGPDIETSDEIIVVEGRADVINLLRNGIRNAVGIEGSKIPHEAIALIKRKITTAFMDGDRGGDLDLKKLLEVAEIDFVARADEGKEVEELTKKEIYKALREKEPLNQAAAKRMESRPSEFEEVIEEPVVEQEDANDDAQVFFNGILEDLVGTRAAYLVDRNKEVISKLPLAQLPEMISDFPHVYAIAVDGKIGQDLVDLAKKSGISIVAGMGVRENVNEGHVRIIVLENMIPEE